MSRVTANPYSWTAEDVRALGYHKLDLKKIELERLTKSLSNLTDPNLPVELRNLLIRSEHSIEQIIQKYASLCAQSKHYVVAYFIMLQNRLQQSDLTYLTLFDYPTQPGEYDFASIGPRFWDWLVEMFDRNANILRNYSILIYRYLEIIPEEILTLRYELNYLEKNLPEKKKYLNRLAFIDAFKQIDKSELYCNVTRIPTVKGQLDYVIKSITRPQERKRLYDQLCYGIEQHPFLSTLKPCLIQIGTFESEPSSNINIDYLNLHFHLSFELVNGKALDEYTKMQIGYVMSGVMYSKFNLPGVYWLDWNQIVFDMAELDLALAQSRLSITVQSEMAPFAKLVNFYLEYESRFGEMVTLLKYCFVNCRLLHKLECAHKTFVWMVIAFLGRTKPQVLPTVKQLRQLSQSPHEFCTNVSLVGQSLNRQSTGELIVEFIHFYYNFDFETKALHAFDGSICDKSDLNAKAEFVCIEDPFSSVSSSSSPYTTLNAALWKSTFSKLLDDAKINSDNFVQVLINPEYFPFIGSEKPKYLKMKPQDPYLLTETNAILFEYPNEIDHLCLVPEYNPFTTNCAKIANPLKMYQFVEDFIFTDQHLPDIIQSYDREQLQVHYENVLLYFSQLQTRLSQADVTYENIFSTCELHKQLDYASYGDKFWLWLVQCKLFPVEILRNYSIVIYCYLELFPWHILRLRKCICLVHLQIVTQPVKPIKCQLASHMEPTDEGTLDGIYTAIAPLNNTQGQINQFISRLYFPNQAAEFVNEIVRNVTLRQTSLFKEFGLQFIQMGTFASKPSLSIYSHMNSFLFNVSFRKVIHKLDCSTSVLASQLMVKAVSTLFNVQPYTVNEDYVGFEFDSTSVEASQLWLMTSPRQSAICRVFYHYSEYNARFDEMVLILQYWCTVHGFYQERPFLNYDFVWLIVYFLQRTTPPVLLSFESLPDYVLERNYGNTGSWANSNSQIANTQSTTELIVDFFHFIKDTQFSKQVICPRNATAYSTELYRQVPTSKLSPDCAYLEDPIDLSLFQWNLEHIAQVKQKISKLIDVHQINKDNCMLVLTKWDKE